MCIYNNNENNYFCQYQLYLEKNVNIAVYVNIYY